MEIEAYVKSKVNIKSVSVHVKVCDSGDYDIKDSDGNVIKAIAGYVPSFFPGEHYGDCLILDIDIETGVITNWKKPTQDKLMQLFKIEE